jgi:uncharacterized membrane protein
VISRITSVSVRSRGLLLLPAGALVVHQLRYRIAYGPRAGAQLAAQGHSYLDSFAPWLVLLLCLAAGSFLARLVHAAATGSKPPRRRSFAALWAATTVGLVSIYAVQELLEGFFAAGHPGGLAGVVGHGGWWAAVVAVGVGAVVAAVLRVADAAVEAFARERPRAVRQPLVPRALPAPLRTPLLRPLASAHAGRAPPAGLA